ncbi:MAG: response regulator [Clostridiales bacterium]|jgi:two-component system response regulator YesN|nr:response regulator [Clostridiales bacterium]
MYSVVVADDEAHLRKSLIHGVRWESIGFKVVGEASNGAEALDLVEKLSPDLLLTDIKMPFFSGIELARRAREIRPVINIAFISGYDDFNFAQQGIEYNIISYILKPVSAVEMTKNLTAIKEKMDGKISFLRTSKDVKGLKEQLREESLKAFLLSLFLDSNGATKESSLYEAAEALGICAADESGQYHRVMVTWAVDSENRVVTSPEHRKLVDSTLFKYINAGSVHSSSKIISLISGAQPDVNRYSDISAKEIYQSANLVWGASCAIGVSGIFSRLGMANKAYFDAEAACEYSRLRRDGPSFISDIESSRVYSGEDIHRVTTELERLLKFGSVENVREFLAKIFDEKLPQNGRILLLEIISTVYRAAGDLADDAGLRDIFSNLTFLDNILLHAFSSEAASDVIRCAESVNALIAERRKKTSSLLVDRAMDIIWTEYGDEALSLASLSDRLHISVSYLSALLKKTKGDSFINLLTHRRMEAAKEKVLCTGKKNIEIAAECGYSDQHYFSYCFKKYHGLSPNKMRDSVR